MNHFRHTHVNPRRGSMAVMMAICLPVVLILAAFAVDVAYMQLVRTELRIATDAATLAGGRTLSTTQSTGDAINAAKDAAQKNNVSGKAFKLHSDDVVLGTSTRSNSTSRWQFSAGTGGASINSLQVNGSKSSGSAAGSSTLFFGNIWGQNFFEPAKSATSIQIDRDIALILDRSSSMALHSDGSSLSWTSGGKVHTDSRWADLEESVNKFLDALETSLPTEKVSLTTFWGDADIELELDTTYGGIRTRLQEISDNYDGSGTAIGTGMEVGMPALLNSMTARPFARKTIVVMTDGGHNTGTSPDIVAADLAANYDVTIHTITFSTDADQTLMQQVATNGGGQHWHADDKAELISIFNAIAKNVPTLLMN